MDGTPIRIRRSAVPGKRPTIDQLLSAELAYNTYDGELTARRDRAGIGTDIIRIGAGATISNLIWVTPDGNDSNSGLRAGDAKATIKAAVADSKDGTVIRVTAGTYVEDNPIKLPPQVSVIGDSLREVTVTPRNNADLFFVGRGNYITGMSFIKEGNTYPLAIAAFDPDNKQYINQSTYVQNCTNFIPNSIGLRINGNHALGPLKSMVLDSYTQYNANGIGISITNEGYAQLVSLFTICSDTSVYCDTGGSCDLTNSNSSFGNFGLVANGVGPLKYTGILTSPVISSDFIIELNVATPTFNVTDADFNNKTGVIQIDTDLPHKFRKGMGVELAGIAFTCNSSPNFTNISRYQDAANLIVLNKQEIVDKSLASIAIDHPDFYFPGDNQTTAYSRYKDSYRLIQKNKEEIVDKSLASIAIEYPDFSFPGDTQHQINLTSDSYRLIQKNKSVIVGIAWTSIINQYPALSSTETKCKRDLGYFVDAISADIFTRGNRYSRDFTKQYFNSVGVAITNGINDVEEINGALVGFISTRELMKQAITNTLVGAAYSDLTITADIDPLNGPISNTNPTSCDGVQNQINTLVGIVTNVIGTSNVGFLTTVAENKGVFTAGSSKCKRDIEYFVDAVSTDVFLGGNKYSRDFTKQYFNAVGLAITNGLVGEQSQSVYAFNSARDLMKGAITNQLNFKDLTITADPSPTSGIVTNTNTNSCTNVQNTISTLVGIVTVGIASTNLGFINSIPENTRTFIATGENKCSRDIGYIVDAVANDLKFNTNANIFAAANTYFNSSGNPISNGLVGEEAQSITAFTAVRNYSKLAINNQLNKKDLTITADPLTGSNNSQNSCSNVKSTIDTLVGIVTISIGTATRPGNPTIPANILVYPDGTRGYIFDVIDTAPGRFIDGADRIEANRKEILDKSLVGIALSYSNFVYPDDPLSNLSYRFKDATRLILKNKSEIVGVAWTNTYNQFICDLNTVPNVESKCKRDLGYFVDAVSTDLYTGGNYYSIEFVKQYFNTVGIAITNGLVGEEVESVYAFNQARDLMKKAITNQLTYKEVGISTGPALYGSIVGSVPNTSPNACTDVQNAINTLVGIVTTTIGSGSTSTIPSVNTGIFLTGENVCRRDLGYVLDAIVSDLKSFTNERTLLARDAYFDQSGIVGIASERQQSIVGFTSLREYAKLAINNQLNKKDFTIIADESTGSNNDQNSCSNVKSFIDNLVSYLITDLTNQTKGNYPTDLTSTSFTVNVGVSTLEHYYVFGGRVNNYISRPFDGQVLYFDQLYSDVASVQIINGGSGYEESPEFIFSEPEEEWGIPAQAVATLRNGRITEVNLVSSGRGYLLPPTLELTVPNAGITTATFSLTMKPTYFSVASSTEISSSGITTITLNENIPYEIAAGAEVYFYKQSRILASSHCMEYIGTGTTIERAIPVLGGVSIQENETISKNGGLVVFTTTDQAGNFRIGDGVVINQNTGRISGTDYTKSLFATMTPFILSLGGD
jgi:hypothetical protein